LNNKVEEIRNMLIEHNELFSKSIPLIASENITSPAVDKACNSDFSHRYAEGWVGHLVYAAC